MKKQMYPRWGKKIASKLNLKWSNTLNGRMKNMEIQNENKSNHLINEELKCVGHWLLTQTLSIYEKLKKDYNGGFLRCL